MHWVSFELQTLKNIAIQWRKKKQHQALADSITIASLIANQNLLSQNSSFRINPNLQVLTEDGVKLLLSDVCDGNKKLIFRYNEFACSPCIFEEMGNINTLAQKIGKKNIIVLTSYQNHRDFLISKKVNNIDLPIYNTPLNSLENTIEKYSIPYIFLLDSNWTVDHLFIPNKNVLFLTDEYFQDIVNYFKTKE